MLRMRQTPVSEGLVRSAAVTLPAGAAFDDRALAWDRLLFASRGVFRVGTDDGRWLVPPHRALWLPSGIRHRVEVSRRVSLRTLYFRPSVSRRLPRQGRIFGVSPLLRELILYVVGRCPIPSRRGADGHALELLLSQLSEVEPVPLRLPFPRDDRALAAANLLSKGDRRALEAVARSSGASGRTLQRLFVAETGLTFERWRQRAALLRAVERLAEGRSVTSVAADVGYESPSAFIAMFRRELGSTPRRYLLASAEAR